MNADELAVVVPQLLERYRGCWRLAESKIGRSTWILQYQGTFGIVCVVGTAEPSILINFGVAIGVPRSVELADCVADADKIRDVGRVFLAGCDRGPLVVVSDALYAASLSWGVEPNTDTLVSRIEAARAHALDMGAEIRERFGGTPFSGEDWEYLARLVF